MLGMRQKGHLACAVGKEKSSMLTASLSGSEPERGALTVGVRAFYPLIEQICSDRIARDTTRSSFLLSAVWLTPAGISRMKLNR